MCRSLTLAGISFCLLLAVCLPAKADTINTFNFSTNLVGASGTVSGSFTFNTQTNTFTSASLTFNSPIFGNFMISAPNPQNGFLFVFGTQAAGNAILYSILVNPFNLSQYWVSGGIAGHGGYGNFNYTPVPEGAEWFLYLIPAACVMFGGIVLAGKQRQTLHAVRA
jgi:hypothetical protein